MHFTALTVIVSPMARFPLFVMVLAMLQQAIADPVISEFLAKNDGVLKDNNGEYSDWIEIYNPDQDEVNLKGYYLTDSKKNLTQWQFPSVSLPAGGFVIVYASDTEPEPIEEVDPLEAKKEILREFDVSDRFINRLTEEEMDRVIIRLREVRANAERAAKERRVRLPRRRVPKVYYHANFKLTGDGEYLALVKPDGKTICHDFAPKYPEQVDNVSYGLIKGGTPNNKLDLEQMGRLLEATPGMPNSTKLLGIVRPVRFDQTHGYFQKPFALTLSSGTADAEIRYTTNGSAPTQENGQIFDQPLPIASTTVLRAAAFKTGHKPTAVVTQTYLFLDDVIHQPEEEAPPGWPQYRRYEQEVNRQELDYGMDPEVVGGLHTKDEVKEALMALPVMSVVADIDDLFGERQGIYVNAQRRGRAWERPSSLELIHPDGSKGFQIDGGIRARGGFSRQGRNPKHCLRFIFRKEYGAGKLKYPLFEDEGVEEFDHIDLRSSMNYAWAFDGNPSNTMLRDVFSRDLQGDMGQPHTRSRFYHLYLNGHYWGVYMTQERSEASFAAHYMGGDEEDYDVVKTRGQVVDGNRDSYNRIYRAVVDGFDDDTYFRLQGMNPDGTRNPEYERLVDVENLIDYMIITIYTGDKDGPGGTFMIGNNYWAIYNRESPDGYKFFEHDSEHSLDLGAYDMSGYPRGTPRQNEFNPHWLHIALSENKHYARAFSDRVEKHFFDNGVLTLENNLARLDKRAQTIDKAIIAHSARWGDAQRRDNPLTRKHWLSAVENIKEWMETRQSAVLEQFHDAGIYDGIPAPKLNRAQGVIAASSKIFVMEGQGQVYLTTDGTDPRGSDDEPSASARLTKIPKAIRTSVLRSPAKASYLIPENGRLGSTWITPDFDDSSWQSGSSEIGYEARPNANPDYGDVFGTNLREIMHDITDTAYIRIPFQVDDPASFTFDEFHLKMKYDDGFIAYLNGKPIAADNAPNNPQWDSSAVTDHSDDQALEFVVFQLTAAKDLLVNGRNVLAIHGLDGERSSDFLIVPELEGVQLTGAEPIALTKPETIVRARALHRGKWSPPLTATFQIRN